MKVLISSLSRALLIDVLVIDYTKHDPNDIIAPQSVDFILDTTGQAMHFLSLVTPKTGTIISISTLPSGAQLQNSSIFQRPEQPRLFWPVRILLDASDAVRKLRAYRWGVRYEYLFLQSNAEDLEILSGYVEAHELVSVIGSITSLHDIDKFKEVCQVVYDGKGGLGKAVLEVIQ